MDFRDIKEFVKELLKYILTLFIVIIIVLYVASLQQVVGSSMESMYYNGDVVLIDKIFYKFTTGVRRNDIISFYTRDEKYLIKRVIGLPGEAISYHDNYLYIDDKKYDETIIPDDVTTNDFTLMEISGYNVIPEDMYLVLGDNRENSKDSRQIGLISKDDIIGRVIIRIWPIKW